MSEDADDLAWQEYLDELAAIQAQVRQASAAPPANQAAAGFLDEWVRYGGRP